MVKTTMRSEISQFVVQRIFHPRTLRTCSMYVKKLKEVISIGQELCQALCTPVLRDLQSMGDRKTDSPMWHD